MHFACKLEAEDHVQTFSTSIMHISPFITRHLIHDVITYFTICLNINNESTMLLLSTENNIKAKWGVHRFCFSNYFRIISRVFIFLTALLELF